MATMSSNANRLAAVPQQTPLDRLAAIKTVQAGGSFEDAPDCKPPEDLAAFLADLRLETKPLMFVARATGAIRRNMQLKFKNGQTPAASALIADIVSLDCTQPTDELELRVLEERATTANFAYPYAEPVSHARTRTHAHATDSRHPM